MKGQGALFSSASGLDDAEDRWATPDEVFAPLHAEFGFTLDAAAIEGNRRTPLYLGPDHPQIERRDGRAHPWVGATWCNPPYSAAGEFAAQAQRQVERGVTSVLLVFARTDTAWWWRHVLGRDTATRERLPDVVCADEIRWRPGRITFLDPATGAARLDKHGRPQSAPAPSVAIVYRPGLRQAWPENGVLR